MALVVSEPVEPYFTRGLRVLTFCPEVPKIVIFYENGVVNGGMECNRKFIKVG